MAVQIPRKESSVRLLRICHHTTAGLPICLGGKFIIDLGWVSHCVLQAVPAQQVFTVRIPHNITGLLDDDSLFITTNNIYRHATTHI